MGEGVSTFRSRLDLAATILMMVASVLLIALIGLTFIKNSSGTRTDTSSSGNVPITTRRTPHLPPVPVDPISFDGSARLGEPDAPVVVMVFSDFGCPACRMFSTGTMPMLKNNQIREGLVEFVYRHLPLPIHPGAFRVAEVSECARRQGKFWLFHDSVFEGPSSEDVGDVGLEGRAADLGLDPSEFDQCLAGDAARIVTADIALAEALEVRSTPTLMVGRRDGGTSSVRVTSVYVGALRARTLAEAIDSALVR